MARNLEGIPFDGLICAAMDARCQQVYTALFDCVNGRINRRTPDEAISLEDLKNRLISEKKSIIMVGDGAKLCYNTLKDSVAGLCIAPAASALSAGGWCGGGGGRSLPRRPNNGSRPAAAGLSAAASGGKRIAQAAVCGLTCREW